MLERVIKFHLIRAANDIRKNMSKVNATGKTKDSIEVKVTNTGGQILANESILYVERGRGPAKKSTPKWKVSDLLKWMQVRGVGSELDNKKRRSLAEFIKYKINQFGTRKFQQGGGDIVDNIYTQRLDELTEELEEAISAQIENDNFNIDFKGKYASVN